LNTHSSRSFRKYSATCNMRTFVLISKNSLIHSSSLLVNRSYKINNGRQIP
jgi:hypothetical protein